MGRKKAFKCPVGDCTKRGQLSDLIRHARVKHPDIPEALIRAALQNGVLVSNVSRETLAESVWRRAREWLIMILGFALAIILVLIITKCGTQILTH